MTTRVLHVCLALHPGGAERLIVDLARSATNGIETHVCCLDERGAWAAELDDAGVPVTVLGREAGFHPGLGAKLAAHAASIDAAVLHAHQYTPFVYSCLAKLRRPGLRLVFTEHGRLAGATVSPKRKLANAVLGRTPGRFYAVCEELRGFLLEEGFPPARLGVLYNGIPIPPVPDAAARRAARGELGLPENAFVVGSIARLDPVKDLATLLRALAALPGADEAHLVLIGDGPERASLEALATELGIAGRVHFAGARSDARELLPAFDLYVNSSSYEGVSLTIIEAMAAVRPVVATRVGGTPEVITHEQDGLLVPAGEPAALAEALGSLHADPERSARLAAAARATAERRFRFEDMRDAYEAAYREEA